MPRAPNLTSLRPVAWSAMLLLGAVSLPACLFLVNEAPGNGGNGSGGNGANGVGGQGGQSSTASVTGSAGTAGGGGGGGPPPACFATLGPVSNTTRPAVKQLVVTADPTVDVFVISGQDGSLDAHESSDLRIAPTVETAGIGDDPRITAHHAAGVVLSNGYVQAFRYDLSGSFAIEDVWYGGDSRQVREAVSNGDGYFGRLENGEIHLLEAPDALLAAPLHLGPAALLTAHEGGISWIDTSGVVSACATPSCGEVLVSDPIPGAPAVFDSLSFDPARGRYFAVVAAAAEGERKLFTGTLESPPTLPVELAAGPFVDVVAAALTPEHLVVLSDEDVRVCCLDSLFGDTPCGEPVVIQGGEHVAAHERRVVVHATPEGSIELRAFDIDPDGAGGAGGGSTR